MCAALDDGCGGNDYEACLLLEFLNGRGAAGAHCCLNLCKGYVQAVLEVTCIRNVRVNAFFESHLAALAAVVVTLPVARTVGAFAPILFNICAAYKKLSRRGFVESCEITSEHHEISAHSESQCHVVVMNDTAVRAKRNVISCLFEVLVTSLSYGEYGGRSLAAADTLLLTCDADGTAADTDLDEVCAAVSQEPEALSVNNVACADDGVRIILFAPLECSFLPYGETVGGVKAENVSACFEKGRNTLLIVSCIDSGTDDELLC